MKLRDLANRRSSAVVVGLLAVTVLTGWRLGSSRREQGPEFGPQKIWFTTDEGKTWFADSVDKVAPFEHDGKIAVRACLFTTDGGRTVWCSHLERYTPASKQRLEAALARGEAALAERGDGIEVKRPGAPEKSWAPASSPQGFAICSPQAPVKESKALEAIAAWLPQE